MQVVIALRGSSSGERYVAMLSSSIEEMPVGLASKGDVAFTLLNLPHEEFITIRRPVGDQDLVVLVVSAVQVASIGQALDGIVSWLLQLYKLPVECMRSFRIMSVGQSWHLVMLIFTVEVAIA
jgi:hypothetical protein